MPESYADAKITFNEVVKNNDTHLTGMSIARPGEQVVPNIYIENFWNDYQKGKNIDEIAGDIADIRIEYDDPSISPDMAQQLMNYDGVKDKLQIRLCDTQENQDRLATLVHTEHSDFSATYHVNLQETKEGIASMAVTPTVLETWGITVEQLHQDALALDMNRHPMFCDMQNMMESMMFGKEPENLLDDGSGQSGMGMDVKELSAMVQQVNETEVSTEDRLSDHVQHYDSKEAVMENAEKRVSRLEKEKAETKAAKKSIHDRLGEKKQQSAAKKAEKAVEKAVKKDKGQEL